MPDLLLELFSEEIPARMQAAAARDLERLARERLAAEGLLPEALKTFAGSAPPTRGPRRSSFRSGWRAGMPCTVSARRRGVANAFAPS